MWQQTVRMAISGMTMRLALASFLAFLWVAPGAFAGLLKDHPDDRLAAFHATRLAAGEVGATIVLREK